MHTCTRLRDALEPFAAPAPQLLRYETVRSILEDSKGNTWFGSWMEGVCRFDGEKIIAPTNRDYASKDEWLLEPGDIWFKEDGSVGATATEGRPGVYRYDGETFTYLTFPPPADASNLTTYANTGMSQGKTGRVWFATYGAWRYDGKTLKNFTAADGLTSKDIFVIYTDRRGDLWLGGHGVFKFNGVSFDRIH